MSKPRPRRAVSSLGIRKKTEVPLIETSCALAVGFEARAADIVFITDPGGLPSAWERED
jgi:hypothetical protein